jgi:hypothetical protein
VLSVIGVATCVEPTEMHVTLYSDICEKLDVTISTDDKPPSAQKVFARPVPCTGRRRLGDIVFVPSNAGGRFTFRVRAAAEGGDCAANVRCVSASRNVGYLDHTSLQLDIDLTSDCIGVQCASTQTCDHGKCVDAFVDCKTKTCEDAGARDVSVVDVITPIESGACLPPPVVLNMGTAPSHYWSFSGNLIKDHTSGAMSAFANGTTTTMAKSAFGCGDSLATSGIQPLNVMQQTKGLGMSMYAYIPATGPSTNFLLTKLNGSGQAIKIFVDYKQELWVQTCNGACADTIVPGFPTDRWVAVEVKAVSTGSVTVAVDGVMKPATTSNVNATAFATGGLQLGDGQAWIDELRIYDLP